MKKSQKSKMKSIKKQKIISFNIFDFRKLFQMISITVFEIKIKQLKQTEQMTSIESKNEIN